MRRCRFLALAALAVAPWWASAAPAPTPSLGVVPFARQGASEQAAAPDLAAQLAARLRGQELGEIVDPSQAGAALHPDTAGAEIRQRAESLGVDALIVGSTRRAGQRIHLDFRLYLANSQSPIATYVAEVASPDQLGPTLDRLAREVAGAARTALAPPEPPAVSAQAPAGEDPDRADGSDAPISITSEEMEAYQNGDVRRFVFLRNVRVSREDMTLTSDRLEAFYPDSTSQPNRLVATGRVRVTQRDRQARCDEATYLRGEDRIVCRGGAELRQGCNRVRGEVIELDLASEHLVVNGNASAILYPQSDDDLACEQPAS